jgi:hypothetical protein
MPADFRSRLMGGVTIQSAVIQAKSENLQIIFQMGSCGWFAKRLFMNVGAESKIKLINLIAKLLNFLAPSNVSQIYGEISTNSRRCLCGLHRTSGNSYSICLPE